MKTRLFIFLLLFILATLCAQSSHQIKLQSRDRTIPQWNWQTTPQPLHENYADYFQAYTQTPLSVMQNGGGANVVFRVKDQEGHSIVSHSHISPTGDPSITGLGVTGYYCDSVTDQITGDVFGCWHGPALDSSEGSDCFLSYNLFHENGDPLAWKEIPITVIDSDTLTIQYPFPTDEFIWPQVHIGPSPLENNRRVYLAAKNLNGVPGELTSAGNFLIAYADFCADSLDLQSDLDWQYTTIPFLDWLNAGIPDWGRAKASLTVNDNQLICMGYISYDDSDAIPDSLFCCVNDNYGEGFWEYYTSEAVWDVEIPEEMNTEPPMEAEFDILFSEQLNLFVSDNQVRFAGTAGLTFDSGMGAGYFYPDWCMMYPKTFNFNLNTDEFSFTDVYPMGADPNDENMMTPWDLDEDGEIDEYDPNGYPLWFKSWPYYHYNPDLLYHYNQMYITGNPDNNWLAIVWADGLNAFCAHEELEGYESWNELPEIAVCISDDNGNTWSDPIFMNGNPESENYVPELEDMIPCYIYPGDYIEDLGNNEGLLHLFFLDDNEFGSYHSNGEGSSGLSTFQYAAIAIDFPSMNTDENSLLETPTAWNYPNPFNPSTMICFSTKEANEQAELCIYNLKGQKVRTLLNGTLPAGDHQLEWDGKDEKGNSASSGVYFYRLVSGNNEFSGKMIMLK